MLHDDMQSTTLGHIGSLVIPAAYAAAEHVGASWTELIEAIVCGYEVAGRIGKKAAQAVVVGRANQRCGRTGGRGT